MIKEEPDSVFLNGTGNGLSAFAASESGRTWPIADGRISIERLPEKYEFGAEFKMTNEGLHGVLTAIGQSHAYLKKGYSGATIIVPNEYDSFKTPGTYVTEVLKYTDGIYKPTAKSLPIAVFSYSKPDHSLVNPFLNRIKCHNPIDLSTVNQASPGFLKSEKQETQWAHTREGSTELHAILAYLQIAKRLDAKNLFEPQVNIPNELVSASEKFKPHGYLKNLSDTVGDKFEDVVWRHFWFSYVLTEDVSKIWTRDLNGLYHVNDANTKLILFDGKPKTFFLRSDSIKPEIVRQLNLGLIQESDGWDLFAKKIHTRAHSYRVDVTASIRHLGFLAPDGKPSELGYKLVDSWERTNEIYSGTPLNIFATAIMKHGGFETLLHYIFKISEKVFSENPLFFSKMSIAKKKLEFDIDGYLDFLRNSLAYELYVMNTAVLRSAKNRRKTLQAEFSLMKKLKVISDKRYRVGLGLTINWPKVQEYLDYDV